MGNWPSIESMFVPHSTQSGPRRGSNPTSDHELILERHNDAIVRSMHGNLIQSPVKSPRCILDVGCNIGILTSKLGNLFPAAQVYGVDLELANLRVTQGTPRNVNYIDGNIHNLALNKPFLPGSQDFILSRLVMCGMTDWEGYIEKAFEMLKPGGYLELQEEDVDWLVDDESITEDWEWLDVCYPSDALNDFQCAKKAADRMERAGFVNVQVKKFKWPWGDWMAKDGHTETFDIGQIFKLHCTSHCQDMLNGICSDAGYTKEKIRNLKAECAETLETSEKKYKEFYVIWGRKPLDKDCSMN
ncbi:hypothetical protein ACLMJK_008014 [Lecanora helva]